MEFTGQCIDGPNMGDLLTASKERLSFEMLLLRDLGPEGSDPEVLQWKGWYVWDTYRRGWKYEREELRKIPYSAVHGIMGGS